jgi:hypothetical protein
MVVLRGALAQRFQQLATPPGPLAPFAPVLSMVSVPQLASFVAWLPTGAAWTTYPGGAAVTFVMVTP